MTALLKAKPQAEATSLLRRSKGWNLDRNQGGKGGGNGRPFTRTERPPFAPHFQHKRLVCGAEAVITSSCAQENQRTGAASCSL